GAGQAEVGEYEQPPRRAEQPVDPVGAVGVGEARQELGRELALEWQRDLRRFHQVVPPAEIAAMGVELGDLDRTRLFLGGGTAAVTGVRLYPDGGLMQEVGVIALGAGLRLQR